MTRTVIPSRRNRHKLLCGGLLCVLVGLGACSSSAEEGTEGPMDFPNDSNGKTDVFGRSLVGVASPYEAAAMDQEEMSSNMFARRQAAWRTVVKILEPVPLLGLAGGESANTGVVLAEGSVPNVPRFQTWYGIDDLKRMFQRLYGELNVSDRAVRAPFGDVLLADTFQWNATAIERSRRWPLGRYLKYVKELGVCPDEMPAEECARFVTEKTSGATTGNSRILYSPAAAEHVLKNYRAILACLESLDTLPMGQLPTTGDNFTFCLEQEFPRDSVLVKAQWTRSDIGRPLPVYDTDADSLAARLAGTAHWGDAGDRTAEPSAGSAFTIRLRSGDSYRLVGLHIMTKELRHWQWITLWWSDTPNIDFGEDRPATVAESLAPAWSNYKMCVVDDYEEKDPDPAGHFADQPTLAKAIKAIEAGGVGPTWCSNPYLEHGRNNARTNCIGCHQHGGSKVVDDADGDGLPDTLELEDLIDNEVRFPLTSRKQIREVFPADYLYSFNRVDDFANMIRSEVLFIDDADYSEIRKRIDTTIGLVGDADTGGELFAQNCVTCHGAEGTGSGFAPNLHKRVPQKSDTELVQTLLQGRGNMPNWDETLSDQQLADVLAFLRMTFGAAPEL